MSGSLLDLSSPSSVLSLNCPKNKVYVKGKVYLKVQSLGKGGSSLVFKVINPKGEAFALKEVDVSSCSKLQFDSYFNEIIVLEKLRNYDKIIHLYDSEYDPVEKKIYLILELGDVDLASVIEHVAEEQIEHNFLRIIWQQMLEAVSSVHLGRILHGDLKPPNFLFVAGTLKIIDFGIAAEINEATGETTSIERAVRVGTLDYMSPESLLAKMSTRGRVFKVGRTTDIWSLGCILYQLVYARPPFPAPTIEEKIRDICDSNYEIEFPFIEDWPDFEELHSVMKACLQRDPKKRPTIDQLLNHPYLSSEFTTTSHKLLTFILTVQELYPDEEYTPDNEIVQEFADAIRYCHPPELAVPLPQPENFSY